MDHIFTPWRMKYVQNEEKPEGCIFCTLPKETDENALILRRGKSAYVILNRFPYSSGHLMIVPFEHRHNLDLLSETNRSEIMELMTRSISVLGQVYQPDGFNIGGNIGAAGGAGVAEHVHLHVLPRWSGDTNFMTTVANTRVLPEELITTWQRLREKWDLSFPEI